MSSDECSAAAAADGGERRDPSEKQEPHTVMWGIKGPDNPTSQLLPTMSQKCCSGDGEGRKDKGGGGGKMVCDKVVCVCVKDGVCVCACVCACVRVQDGVRKMV